MLFFGQGLFSFFFDDFKFSTFANGKMASKGVENGLVFVLSLPHVTKCLENKKKSIRCCVLGSSWWCTSRRWIWEMVRYVMWTGVLSVGLAMCICWHRCSTCSNIVPADNVFTAEIFDNHSTYYWNLSKNRKREKEMTSYRSCHEWSPSVERICNNNNNNLNGWHAVGIRKSIVTTSWRGC